MVPDPSELQKTILRQSGDIKRLNRLLEATVRQRTELLLAAKFALSHYVSADGIETEVQRRLRQAIERTDNDQIPRCKEEIMDKKAKKILKTPYHTRQLKRAKRHRNFPFNTCPASRHVQMIAEFLAHGKPYPMLQEEPEHCAGSMLSTVASLYAARTEITKLKDRLKQLRKRK